MSETNSLTCVHNISKTYMSNITKKYNNEKQTKYTSDVSQKLEGSEIAFILFLTCLGEEN